MVVGRLRRSGQFWLDGVGKDPLSQCGGLALLKKVRRAGRKDDLPSAFTRLCLVCGVLSDPRAVQGAVDFQSRLFLIKVLPPQAAYLTAPQPGSQLGVKEVPPDSMALS